MRRIQRSQAVEAYIQTVIANDGSPFREIWKFILFCSALGQKTGKRKPLGNVDSGKSIPSQIFSNCAAWPGYLYLLGIVEASDPGVMNQSEENKLLTIFEEYANGGLALLMERFPSGSIDVPAFVDLSLEFLLATEIKPDLEGIQL